MAFQNLITDADGRILSNRERRDHLKQLGLCEFCGDVRVQNVETQKGLGFRRFQKYTDITNSRVYRGYHIACYGGHEALMMTLQRQNKDVTELKEIVRKDREKLSGSISTLRTNPRMSPKRPSLQRSQRMKPPSLICFTDLDDDCGTIVSSLGDNASVVHQALAQSSSKSTSGSSKRQHKRVLSTEGLGDKLKNATDAGTILRILRETVDKKNELLLLHPALNRLLLDQTVLQSLKSYKEDWLDTLHYILLRHCNTQNNSITVHVLDVIIICASNNNCHQYESIWNDIISSLVKVIIPYQINKNTDILMRACCLINCVFMSYSRHQQSFQNQYFTALGDVLNNICQTYSANKHLLQAACTTWMFLTIYDKSEQSNQPKWIEVALGKFPDNRYLWTCLSLFCIHSMRTPQSEEWIKEIIIQYFPTVDWSDHQAWCLHNAFIHSQKKFILSPESFWTVTSSLLATNDQESVKMNILYSWYPERIISSPTLETKIVQSMQRFADNSILQEVACSLLMRLEISFPKETINSILLHIERNGLQPTAISVLQNFFQSSASQNLTNQNIIQQITSVLAPLLSKSSSRKSASLLWSMCCYDSTNQNANYIARSCGREIISVTLSNHVDDDQIIGLLAYVITAAPDEMAIHLNDRIHDVLEKMISIMKISQDSCLVELACSIIKSFSSNEIWKLYLLEQHDLFSIILPCIDNCPGVLKYDVFQIISNLKMQLEDIEINQFREALNHILNSIVGTDVLKQNQDKALKALSAILAHTVPQFISNGSKLVNNIMTILEQWMTEEYTSKYCLIVLWNLVTKVQKDNAKCQFRNILSQRYMIKVIIDTMAQHLGNEQIQEKGCDILWNLIDDGKKMKEVIGDLGGVNTVLIAMQCHMKCVPLQEAALFFLSGMAFEPAIRNNISACGGSDVVLSVMWINLDQLPVILNGLLAMSNLVVNKMTNEIDIMNQRQLEVIVAAMDYFPYDCDVQVSACRLLRNLAFANINVEKMSNHQERLVCALTSAVSNFAEECGERVDFILDRIYSI